MSQEVADVPNVTVAYYDVAATDLKAIRTEMFSKGPLDGAGRSKFAGLTIYHYHWVWDATPDGTCGAANAKVTFNAQVTLPRLTNRDHLNSATMRAWVRFQSALVRHEEQHVRLSYGFDSELTDAIRHARCDDANAAAERVIAKINRKQDELDEQTNHGRLTGAVL